MSVKIKILCIWSLIVLASVLSTLTDASIQNCKRNFETCHCHESYTGYNLTQKDPPFCFKLFKEVSSWSDASYICKQEYSYILNFLSQNSSPYKEVINLGINVLWIGIKRTSGFYIEQSFEPHLFKESKKYGKKWEYGEPQQDCVALNVTSGFLITLDCSSPLPFICQNHQFPSNPISSFVCPKDFLFSFQLMPNTENCIQYGTSSSFLDAEKSCSEKRSSIAPLKTYEILDNQKNFSSFWLKNGSAVCDVKDTICDKSTTHLFICVVQPKNISVISEIQPTILTSFLSTDLDKSSLICDVIVDGKNISDNKVYYQWYKNGIPIQMSTEKKVFEIRFYPDPWKTSPSPLVRQGIYHCEAQVLGSPFSFKSEYVNYFYSDASTYIMIIDGVKKKTHKDYSLLDFWKLKASLNTTMSLVIADMQEKFPDITWEFQNISLHDNSTKITLLLYINQSSFMHSKSIDKTETYEILDKIAKRRNPFINWGDVFVTLKSSDFCFEEIIPSNDTGFDDILTWQPTDQTKNAVSEPLCLNKWKLQTRQCKPDFIEGAKWSLFNYSMCTKYQQSVKDLSIKCQDGFKKTKTGICFQIYETKETYGRALEICSNSSAYLSDFVKISEIEASESLGLSSFWLSPKLFLHKIQSFGMKPTSDLRPFYNKSLIYEKGYFPDEICEIVTKSKYNFKRFISSCDEKRVFICIQHPQRVLESILFSKTWHKMSQSGTCYHIENKKLTWAEANQTCSSFPLKSSLLENIQNLTNYLRFKKILLQLPLLEKTASWWMNLVQENGIFKGLFSVEKPVNYFDWNPDTNFNMLQSAGMLSFDSTSLNKLQWTLKEPSSKESFICEMKTCQDFKGSTYAYIEDRTVLKETEATDYSKIVSNLDIRCVPNGWYLLNSINWYKDGYHLSFIQNSSRLTLTEVEMFSNLTNILSVQGYYQCSIDQEKLFKRVFSPKILYRLPGVHTFVLYVQTESSDIFEDCISHTMDIEMSSEFFTFLKEMFPKNFLHSYYRSISCDSKTLHVHLYFQKSLENEEKVYEQIEGNFIMNKVSVMNLLKNDFNNTLKFTVRSTTLCLEEKTGSNGRYLTWPSTPLGQYAVSEELCITEKKTILRRRCLGDFNVGAFWSSISNECIKVESETTKKLHKLSVSKVTEENIFNLSFSLKILMSNAEEISAADAEYVSQILINMADISAINPEVFDNIVSTIDTVMEAMQMKEIEDFHLPLNTSSKISSAMESIISNLQTEQKIFKWSKNNIALIVAPLNTSTTKFSTGGILKNWDMNVTELYNGTDWQLNKMFETLEAGVVLPDSLVFEKVNETNLNLGVVVQRSAHFEKNKHVVSPQIDVSLGNEHIYDVDPPIEMIFKISQVGDSSLYKCAYWDQQLNDNFGGWSFKGCFSRLINDHQMQCLCDHLTSFAVILELKPGEEILKVHQMTLSIITYVGCSLSILGLGIIILTFITFRKWRKDVKHKILFNLSLALISFLIVFLAGIEKKSSEYELCVLIAVCLHYFMLSSFAWMLVEAVMQYLSFVKVVGTYVPCLMQKAMAFGWGIPLIIVTTILCTDYKFYYSRNNYCWLSDDIFYYAVAAPILTMLLINFLIFVIILYNNTCGRPNKRLRSNQNERKEAITTAKAMFCVSVLLGLSWIFGFLAVDGAKLLFQYLFAVTATLQGFLMSVFFVFRQKSTLDLWLNLMSPVTTPDTSRASHITGTTDITNRFIINHSRQSTPDRFSKAAYKSSLSYITFN